MAGIGLAVRLAAAADYGGLRTGSSCFREPGVFGNGKPPSLVVRQVPVQDVEFVPGHQVQHFLDVPHGHHVAAAVHHDAAPGEAGLVPYLQRGQRRSAAAVRDDVLHEALQSMEPAVGRAAGNGNGIRGDGQAVAFPSQGFVFRKGNVGVLFHHRRFDAVFPEKPLRLYGKGMALRQFYAAFQ